MAKEKVKQKCFIIMPITTPVGLVEGYNGDIDHFTHVLEHLFVPALEGAGFDPIPPSMPGSNIIQADIIKQLSDCDLVLCDISTLNANVFFEFGIRTALNKPVALVVDDKTVEKEITLPFDTNMIGRCEYNSALNAWELNDDIDALTKHLKAAFKKTPNYNALWKYFGVAQTGTFKPGESTEGDKLDLIMKEIASLKDQQQISSIRDLRKNTFQNIQQRARNLSGENIDYINQLLNEGSALEEAGNYQQALNIYNSAQEFSISAFGEDDRITSKVRARIIKTRIKMRDVL